MTTTTLPLPEVTFLPIGENCLAHGVLRRHGLTAMPTPFSHARSNIDYAIQMVESGFRDMLDPAYLTHAPRGAQSLVINTLYTCDKGLFHGTVANGFEFSHHDVIANATAHDSYQRKANRFMESLDDSGPACLIYHYRLHPGQDIGRVVEKLERLRAYWSAKTARPISTVMFTQAIVPDDDQRRVEITRRGDIMVAVLHTRQAWGGNDNDVFWGRGDDDLFDQAFAAFQDHARAAKAPARSLGQRLRAVLSGRSGRAPATGT